MSIRVHLSTDYARGSRDPGNRQKFEDGQVGAYLGAYLASRKAAHQYDETTFAIAGQEIFLDSGKPATLGKTPSNDELHPRTAVAIDERGEKE